MEELCRNLLHAVTDVAVPRLCSVLRVLEHPQFTGVCWLLTNSRVAWVFSAPFYR